MRNVPKLRFKEFCGEWEEKKLGEFLLEYEEKTVINNQYPMLTSSRTEGIVFQTEHFNKQVTTENNIGYNVIPYGYITYRTRSDDGKFVFNRNFLIEKGTISYFYPVFIFNDDLNIDYGLNYINNFIDNQIIKVVTGTSQLVLSLNKLKKINIKVPNINEQEKIGDFFSSVDKKISITEEKLDLFKDYKKGIMQKIFNQELRFKDSNGNNYPEWEEKRLNSIFERITEKNIENNNNVLTISAQYGLISQTDFFNKSVAGKDLTKYYLLHRDDFTYNKSYSAGYPMGAIKRLTKYDKGIVSTLYICFRVKDNNNVSFLEQFFESRKIDSNIQEIAQEGARNHGLLNISVGDFFDIIINLPCLEEQEKIANFLSSIDNKIDNLTAKLEDLKEFKKGLLQQMFV